MLQLGYIITLSNIVVCTGRIAAAAAAAADAGSDHRVIYVKRCARDAAFRNRRSTSRIPRENTCLQIACVLSCVCVI